MSYAAETEVSVERTRAEIETLLMRRGAARFMVMVDGTAAAVAFELNGKMIRFTLPMPDKQSEVFTRVKTSAHGTTRPASPDAAYRKWEQACRSRWRGLFLNIKAKLEAVDIGITTFEAEFLAHFVLAGGKTVGEKLIPQLEEATKSAKFPLLLGGP